MQVGSGGDLQGGLDESRNAEVSALKKLFYNSDAPSESPPDAAGLLLDLPVARWSNFMLPHQQTILNVFQPQYTLMFETLLAKPEPWYYVHVHLPGGADNLANPEYALKRSSQAPLSGTLMQVVSVERLPDARLIMIVQGLERARVVRATQELPYARADVQLLPDSEALLAAARLSATVGDSEPAAVRRQMVMAAAVAEDACWREYEHSRTTLQLEGDSALLPPALCTFNASADAAGAAAREQSSMEAAMRGAQQRMGAIVREREAQARAVAGDLAEYDYSEPYVPPAEGYPARRRAQRLSYAVWRCIRDRDLDMQPLLDQPGTADRLRLALLRLRELLGRVRAAKAEGDGS